jgi:ubiquinone biosynthesis protein UbiJ
MTELEHPESQNDQEAELLKKIKKIDDDLAELDKKINDLEKKTHTIEATGGLNIEGDTKKIALLQNFLMQKRVRLEEQLAKLFK